jgi:hypothetical protein
MKSQLPENLVQLDKPVISPTFEARVDLRDPLLA